MDADRFDRLTKSLSTRAPRRRVARLLSGLALGLGLGRLPGSSEAAGCGGGERKCGSVCIPKNRCCNQTERECPGGSCVPDRKNGPCCPNEKRCGTQKVCVPPCRAPKTLNPQWCVCSCPPGQKECRDRCVTPNCAANQVFDSDTCKCRCKDRNDRTCPDGSCVDGETCCPNERFCNANDSCLPNNECCRNEKRCNGACITKTQRCCPAGASFCPDEGIGKCCIAPAICCNGVCCANTDGTSKCCGTKKLCFSTLLECPPP